MSRKQILILTVLSLALFIAATVLVLQLSSLGKNTPPATPEPAPVTQEPTGSDTPVQLFDSKAMLEGINKICPAGSGSWDIYLEDLSSGEYFAMNASPEGSTVSASLIKLFIMGAVYERISDGSLDHESVYSLVYSMITVSSNEAANELTLLLGGGSEEDGMAAVNAFASSIGCSATKMNRLMLVDNGLQNYTSAADCARFLRMLYYGICVSPDYSAEMLEILRNQQVNDRIPAGLPEGTPVAHKTGDLNGLVFADVGIVYSDRGDFVLCLLCGNPPDYGATISCFGALTDFFYNTMS